MSLMARWGNGEGELGRIERDTNGALWLTTTVPAFEPRAGQRGRRRVTESEAAAIKAQEEAAYGSEDWYEEYPA